MSPQNEIKVLNQITSINNAFSGIVNNLSNTATGQ